jgi:hypothetical protein
MIEEVLEIRTADGTTDALLVRPDSRDPLPAVPFSCNDVCFPYAGKRGGVSG